METQFRNIDVARWPQAVRVEWEREEIRDEAADAPDEMQDGFWPSEDPADAGYIGPGADFAKAQKDAETRMDEWRNDEWRYIGIRAKATVFVPIGGNSFSVFELTSPGLWGIESDSGEDYLAEVFEEQKGELERALKMIGAHFNEPA